MPRFATLRVVLAGLAWVMAAHGATLPATTRQGRYNPRAGGIQLDQSPGYKPTTRSRTGQLLQ